jgi:hypothetical protein
MHALHIALNPVGIADVGEQIYHFVDGTLDYALGTTCYEGCYFPTVVVKGDSEGLPITGVDPGASKARSRSKEIRSSTVRWFLTIYDKIARYWKKQKDTD